MIAVLVALGTWVVKNTKIEVMASWAPSFTGYAKRQLLNVVNSSSDSLAATTTIAVTVDTKSLANQHLVQSDCDDLRVVYQPDSNTHTELSRYLVFPGGSSCTTSTATKVYFSLQATLASAASSTSYYIYYANPQATTPTNNDNAFDIGSADALLVCPKDRAQEVKSLVERIKKEKRVEYL